MQSVPDLSFSELDFLNSRREKVPEDPNQAEKKSRRRNTKAADAEAEISRYFMSGKHPGNQARQGLEATKRSQCSPQQQRQKDAPPSFIDLPEKPFLGFGSCGTQSVSPVKIRRELDARHVPSTSQGDTRSPTKSTSYFSWSRSGPLSQVSPEFENRHDEDKQGPRSPTASDAKRLNTAASQEPTNLAKPEAHCFEGSAEPVSVRKSPGYLNVVSDTRHSSDEHHAKDEPRRGWLANPTARGMVKAGEHTEDASSWKKQEPCSHDADVACHKRTEDNQSNRKDNDPIEIEVSHGIDSVKVAEETTILPIFPACTSVGSRKPILSDATLDALLNECRNYPGRSSTTVASNPNDTSEEPRPARVVDHKDQWSHDSTHLAQRSSQSRSSVCPQNRRTNEPLLNHHSAVISQSNADHILRRPEMTTQPRVTLLHSSSHHQSNVKNYPGSQYISPQAIKTDSRNAWNGYGELYEQQAEDEKHSPERPIVEEGHQPTSTFMAGHESPLLEPYVLPYEPLKEYHTADFEELLDGINVPPYDHVPLSSYRTHDHVLYNDMQNTGLSRVQESQAHDVDLHRPLRPMFQDQFPKFTDSPQSSKSRERPLFLSKDQLQLTPQTHRPQLQISHQFRHFVDLSRSISNVTDEPKGFWTPHKLY